MTPTVAILIPTRNREKILHECLNALAKFTWYERFFVSIMFDDDWEGYVKFTDAHWKFPIVWDIVRPQAEYVGTMNRCYQLALKNDPHLFVNWSDDTKPGKPGWLQDAVAIYQEAYPTGCGIVSFNHHWGDALVTHGIFAKNFVELCRYPEGCMLFPEYIHYGSDNDLTMLAKFYGVHTYAPEIKVDHPDTQITGKYPSMIHREHDTAIWKRRCAQGVT